MTESIVTARFSDFMIDHLLLNDSKLTAQSEDFEIFLRIGHQAGGNKAVKDLEEIHPAMALQSGLML